MSVPEELLQHFHLPLVLLLLLRVLLLIFNVTLVELLTIWGESLCLIAISDPGWLAASTLGGLDIVLLSFVK